ncbi:MAG: rhodanese-like domain-containing protein, partial [Thermomicrobiales bacterium]
MAKTFKQMTDEAMAAAPGITAEEAHRRQQADPNLLLIDVLDLADRKRLGQPTGSVPISAGMLAFRAD